MLAVDRQAQVLRWGLRLAGHMWGRPAWPLQASCHGQCCFVDPSNMCRDMPWRCAGAGVITLIQRQPGCCRCAQILTGAIVVMTAGMCAVKAWVDSSILPHISKPAGKKPKKGGDQSKPKKKQSSWELLTSSPRILNMTLMVMGYGICHKLFTFVWKGQMRLLCPSTAAYATMMADVASFTGAATIALMLVSKFVFQVGPAAGARPALAACSTWLRCCP